MPVVELRGGLGQRRSKNKKRGEDPEENRRYEGGEGGEGELGQGWWRPLLRLRADKGGPRLRNQVRVVVPGLLR